MNNFQNDQRDEHSVEMIFVILPESPRQLCSIGASFSVQICLSSLNESFP